MSNNHDLGHQTVDVNKTRKNKKKIFVLASQLIKSLSWIWNNKDRYEIEYLTEGFILK